MDLGIVVQIFTIAAIAGGAFSYLVLRPLNESIHELKELLRIMKTDVDAHAVKLAEVDQRARSAHHRIDRLEGSMTGGAHE
jgi:hypothetical protein